MSTRQRNSLLATFAMLIAIQLTVVAGPLLSSVEAEDKIGLGIGKVALLPFSDHSHQSSFGDALTWGGNKKIIDHIEDYFNGKDIVVLPQKDVAKFLIGKGIIKYFRDADKASSFAWNIIHARYSSSINKQFMQSLASQGGGTANLSRKEIVNLGKKLGVDAVVRGIILEKKRKPFLDTRSLVEREMTDPFSGMVPFMIGDSVEKGAAYAVATKYENSLPSVKDIKPAGDKDAFPSAEEPMLLVRIYMQNAANGAVVWAGGFNIKYSLAAELEDDATAFDAELGKKIRLAMDSLFTNFYHWSGDLGLEAVIYAQGPDDRITVWRYDLGEMSSPLVDDDKRQFDSELKQKSTKMIDKFRSKLYNDKIRWVFIKEEKKEENDKD